MEMFLRLAIVCVLTSSVLAQSAKPALAPDVALDIRNKQIAAYKLALEAKDHEIAALQAQIAAMQADAKLTQALKDFNSVLTEAPKQSKLKDADKWTVNPDTLELSKK